MWKLSHLMEVTTRIIWFCLAKSISPEYLVKCSLALVFLR